MNRNAEVACEMELATKATESAELHTGYWDIPCTNSKTLDMLDKLEGKGVMSATEGARISRAEGVGATRSGPTNKSVGEKQHLDQAGVDRYQAYTGALQVAGNTTLCTAREPNLSLSCSYFSRSSRNRAASSYTRWHTKLASGYHHQVPPEGGTQAPYPTDRQLT